MIGNSAVDGRAGGCEKYLAAISFPFSSPAEHFNQSVGTRQQLNCTHNPLQLL
jgi:hypothetical protein